MLSQKQEKESMLADVMSKGTAEIKCLIAKNNAVNYYHVQMNSIVMSSNPPVSEDLFNEEHENIFQQSLNVFNQQGCTIWSDIEQLYLREVNSEITRLMSLLSETNRYLNKQAQTQKALVRASQEFLSNPTTVRRNNGMFPLEIIHLYHEATVWAYEGELERALECYEQIKNWSMESRHWRVESLAPNYSDENVYQMRQLPRGYCVIINNENFESILPPRQGSQADVTGLAMVFRNLGFIMSIHNNLTVKGMYLRLREISLEESLVNHDAIVIAILSHGDDGLIYGSDAKGMRFDDIYDMFSTSNCPQLHGKPKIFLIQACRGDRIWGGSSRALCMFDKRGDGVTDVGGLETLKKQINNAPESRTAEVKIIEEKSLTDAIIWYSTIKSKHE